MKSVAFAACIIFLVAALSGIFYQKTNHGDFESTAVIAALGGEKPSLPSKALASATHAEAMLDTPPQSEARSLSIECARLEIPAGALEKDELISLTALTKEELPPLDIDLVNVTKNEGGVRCLPHGIHFTKAVNLYLAYDTTLIPTGYSESDITTFYFDEERGRWMPIPKDTILVGEKLIASLTTHFTDFINGIIKVPDAPETQAYTPTSIKDLKAADPSTGVVAIAPPTANNMGTANLQFPLKLPAGRQGMQPQVGLRYNSGGDGGWTGMGWDCSFSSIGIETRWGVPRYSPILETETYTLDGAQLSPVAHRSAPQARSTGDKQFHPRVEGGFSKIIRHGDNPKNYWWEVTDKEGNRSYYGGRPSTGLDTSAVLMDADENIAHWALREFRDLNGNFILYHYTKVNDTGVSGGSVSGQQIYPTHITYTGYGSEEGKYTVQFIRDRTLGEPLRQDVNINARLGFKQVTADLLRKIEITYDSEPVRSYELEYTTGAFYKTLLTAIIEKDKDGQEFYRQGFEYFDEVRQGGEYQPYLAPEDWDIASDNLEGTIQNLQPGFEAKTSAISGSTSKQSSTGGAVTFGPPILCGSKEVSVGVNFSGGDAESEGIVTLVDINGDNLPDKLFRKETPNGTVLFYQPNLSGATSGMAKFGTTNPILGIDQFSQSNSNSSSFGWEANFFFFVGNSSSESESQTKTYMSDFNGDGLMDIAQDNQVYFNQIDANGTPVFTPESDLTPNPIVSGASIDNTLITVTQAERDYLIDKYPLHDVVRVWRAPYQGIISISDSIKRILPQTPAGINYAKKDKLRVAIQVRGNEEWFDFIEPGDTSVRTPFLTNIAVDSGDQVYFRIQSVFNGAYDEIVSNPEIKYANIPDNEFESNGLQANRFKASEDFLLASPQMVTLLYEGKVVVKGDFVKPVTSDSLTLEIVRKRNMIDSVLFSQGFAWDAALTYTFNQMFEVDSDDDISIRVKSATNIEWSELNLAPQIYYIEAQDANGDPISVTDANGDPKFAFCPAVGYSMLNHVLQRTQPFITSSAGILEVSPGISFAQGIIAGQNTPNVLGQVTLSVKGLNKLFAKKTYDFQIVGQNGTVQPDPDPISVFVEAGEQVFIEYHFDDPGLLDSVKLTPSVSGVTDNLYDPGVFTNFSGDDLLLGPLFRGWGQFVYNGNREWADSIIVENELKLDPAFNNPPDQSEIMNMDTGSVTSQYNPAYARFIVMLADTKNKLWRGYDDKTWLKAGEMSSSRMGRDDVSLDYFMPPNGTGLAVPNKITRSNSDSWSFGGSIPISIVGLSGSYNTSSTTTETMIDLMDMNGDRFPDILGRDKIQHSNPLGGRDNLVVPHQFAGNHIATAEAWSVNLGGSFSQAATINTGTPGGGAPKVSIAKPSVSLKSLFKCEKAPQTAGLTIGMNVSPNIATGENDDETQHTWLDVNGDGLPDKVFKGDSVALNLGYEFTQKEKWGYSTIRKGESEDFSGGLGLGINIGQFSFSAGFGLSRTDNRVTEALQDVNGDGLVDIVTLDNPLKVILNTGNGFGNEILLWKDATAIEYGSSTGESSNFAATLCIHLLPFLPVVKICGSLNHSSGTGVSREEFQISDINGDGYPDLLSSNDDGQLTVRSSTIGRTNLLKTVQRPFGSSFSLDYKLEGNTYDMPQSQWVLTSVELFDGFAGDGVDRTKYVFEYENGFYNRREREFYGFKTVKTTQLNTGDNDAPYRETVSTYDNGSYYTKGLMTSEITQAAGGGKYLETLSTYEVRDLSGQTQPMPVLDDAGAYFPALVKTEKLFYEGQDTAGLQTSTTFDYDTLGNITYYSDSGDNTPGDMLSAEIEYHDNATLYIKALPKSISVSTQHGVVRRREADIDSEGNVKQIRQFLENGQAATFEMEYFGNGNLKKITRPPNHKNQRLWFEYEYDDQVNTYVTKVSDAYGYTSSSVHEYLFGQLLETTDLNNHKTTYAIDNRGRIITILAPYEIAAGKPYTIAFEYHPEAQVPYARTKHYDLEHDADIETVTFMDGLMRPIQVKKLSSLFTGDGSDDQLVMIVSGRVHFDAFGRTDSTWYPVVEPLGNNETFNPASDTLPPVTSTFDVLDRTLTTTLPDGSKTKTDYGFGQTNTGYTAFQTTLTDALDNVRATFTDVRERQRATMAVGPQGDIWTNFDYNAVSELLKVTDHAGNLTEYEYDLLGRRLSVTQPDAGKTDFSYDLTGNKLTVLTAQLRSDISDTAFIKYTYDHERLLQVDYPKNYQNKVEYHYGEPGAPHNRAGRIWLQEDASGGHEYFYGLLGEVEKEIRTLLIDPAKMETYVWETKYDTWNRVQKMWYPDGEEVDYVYNRAGKLQRLTSKKKAYDYVLVDQLGYDKFEQRSFLKLGNGTVTNYTYDPARRWLTQMDVTALLGRKIMDNSYTYDLMSNVLSITNNTMTQALKLGGPATHTFSYDKLYRLTEASGDWTGHNRQEDYTLLMEYDNLHNIVRKTQAHHRLGEVVAATTYDNQYVYNAVQPHAPAKIGRRSYSYDANGNFTGWKTEGHFSWRQVLWDEENRISAISDNGFVSQYTYDASGERAIKSSGGVQSVFMNGAPAGFIAHQKNYTAYVSPYLVAKEGRFTKHYFIEGQRIGSRIGTGYFQNRFFGKGLTAGNLNYNIRANLLKQAVLQHYLNLNKPPGVPTAQGHHGDPDTTGIPLPVANFSDSAYSAPPVDWVLPPPPNPATEPPGVPVPPLVPITNADIKAGYGFNGDGIIHAEANQYFFHPDHLGSTSYVTDVNGEIRQHVEYMPFGETFVDEHTSDGDQPYLFNAKELDAETGLYYYGARYYDPMASIWASVDPMAEKYPGWSPYNYVLQNPARLVDPDGRDVEEFALDYSDALKGYGSGLWSGVKGLKNLLNKDAWKGLGNIVLGGYLSIAGENLSETDALLGTNTMQAVEGLSNSIASFVGKFNSGDAFTTGEAVGQLAFALLPVIKQAPSSLLSKSPVRGGGAYLYHYTTEEAAQSISTTGLIPRNGVVYTTPNGNLSPIQAQIELGLSPNQARNALFEINVNDLNKAGINPISGPKPVSGTRFTAGGGTEILFNKPIDAKFLKRMR